MTYIRTLIGLAVWIGAIAAGAGWFNAYGRTEAGRLALGQLWDYFSEREGETPVVLPEAASIAAGDPIYYWDRSGRPRQIGEIARVAQRPSRRGGASGVTGAEGDEPQASVLFYATAPPAARGGELVYYETPDSAQWVLQTLLPPKKRRLIAEELRLAYEQHHEEIAAALAPVVESSLREAARVVEQDLAAALARRRPELEALGDRYQREIVEREIVPLVRSEIWPIVRRHAEPVANDIGHDIWERASLWRFGWRFAYDKSPLPNRDLVGREWERFIAQEAMPVLETRTEEFIRLQQQILSDVARNRRVRYVVRDSLTKIVDDPELQRIVWDVLQEVLVENPRLHQVMRTHWTSDEAREALSIATERLEPTVVRIGELLLGSKQEGITPEFASVLRKEILGKDRRWLELQVAHSKPPAQHRPLIVREGGVPRRSPFLVVE